MNNKITVTKKVLFLDDRSKRFKAAIEKYPAPEYDLTIVCTVAECCERLANGGMWDIVSLDHDLNYESFVESCRDDCGMEVVRFIIEHHKFLLEHSFGEDAQIIVHSKNKIAAVEMEKILKQHYHFTASYAYGDIGCIGIGRDIKVQTTRELLYD